MHRSERASLSVGTHGCGCFLSMFIMLLICVPMLIVWEQHEKYLGWDIKWCAQMPTPPSHNTEGDSTLKHWPLGAWLVSPEGQIWETAVQRYSRPDVTELVQVTLEFLSVVSS